MKYFNMRLLIAYLYTTLLLAPKLGRRSILINYKKMSSFAAVADFDLINGFIKECDYITHCVSNPKKDPSSLSFLVDRPMSQSDCIKLGVGVEKLLVDTVEKLTGLENIRPKNTKGEKERDHLFKDDVYKVIYYAELKSNINLDTEKSKSTYTKCMQVVEELHSEYPDYEIKWCLLAHRYISVDDIPLVIKKKYALITSQLFGINQYFNMIGISFQFTEEKYKEYINNIANEMFK
jgi:hypothetical protein